MKKLYILASILLFSILGYSQTFTTVSGTVVDGTSQAWSNGSVTASLQAPQGYSVSQLLNGGHVITDATQVVNLDNSGAFSLSADSNTAIIPVGSTWNFTICPNASFICTTINVVITGGTQNLSSLITAAIPNGININVTSIFLRAYSDSEVVGGNGATYWRTSDNTLRGCISAPSDFCGGTGGGTWSALGGSGGGISGPGTSTVGNFVCWNSTTGSAVSDCGFTFPIANAQIANAATTVINGTTVTLGQTYTISAAPSGSATGIDISGTYPTSLTVVGFNGVPKCTSFSISNGQVLGYVTTSSPNPCYTGVSNGSLTNPMTTLGDIITGGASGTPARLAAPTSPNGVPQTIVEIPSSGVATALVYALPGVPGNAQTNTTYPFASTDCTPNRVVFTGSSAISATLPTPTTLAVPNCSFKVVNNTTTTVTITPTTFTISENNGSTGASLTLLAGQQAIIYVDPVVSNNWVADVQYTAGVIAQEINGACSAGNVPFSFTNATGSGLYYTGSASITAMCTNGSPVVAFTAGTELTSTGIYGWSNSGTITGSKDTGISRGSAAGLVDFGNGSQGDETSFIRNANQCRLQADLSISVSGTAVNICSFTLPAIQKLWRLDCHFGWVISAGTTPTLSFGVNPAQTPATTTNIFAEIKTTNTGTMTEGSAALSTSGALNVLTSPTLTTSATAFQAGLYGTILSNATSGTLLITATGTGTSVAGSIKAGSSCELE